MIVHIRLNEDEEKVLLAMTEERREAAEVLGFCGRVTISGVAASLLRNALSHPSVVELPEPPTEELGMFFAARIQGLISDEAFSEAMKLSQNPDIIAACVSPTVVHRILKARMRRIVRELADVDKSERDYGWDKIASCKRASMVEAIPRATVMASEDFLQHVKAGKAIGRSYDPINGTRMRRS